MAGDSSVGTMPARGFDWDAVRFPARQVERFATLHYGKSLVEAKRRPGTVPMYGTNGRCGWHDTSLADGPGVILGRKGQGHLGVEWCDVPFWVIDTAYYAEVDPSQVDLRWFYYITKYVGLDELKSGEKPGLSRDVFYRQLFPLPALPEQRAIARVLGMLDDKIELNRRMNATLEGLARVVFRSWFVDFDPVVAKASGRRPVGMSAATAALFPDSFTDSPLGPIPKGWCVESLPAALDVNPPRKLPAGTPAPYLDMGNMPTSSARALGWIDRVAGSGMRFQNGDTLVARITPCLENGKTAYVDFLPEGQIGWGSTEYIVLRSKPPLPPEFAYLLARTEEFRSHAIANMTGSSGRQRVPAESLSNFSLAVPDQHVAERFGEWVRPLFEAMKIRGEASESLSALRDALLPRLLSGELRLRDAEKLVEIA